MALLLLFLSWQSTGLLLVLLMIFLTIMIDKPHVKGSCKAMAKISSIFENIYIADNART